MSAPKDRLRRIIENPVSGVLASLAVPSMAISAAQVLTGVVDTALMSRFTIAHLAALALVVPFFSMVQMVSVGGMGGAIASMIGRALGAKDLAKARALVWQGQYMAVLAGLACALFWWLAGPRLLQGLSADARTVELAYHYGLWLFLPGITLWCQNALSSALRGAGEVTVLLHSLIPAYLLQGLLAAALIWLWPELDLAALGLAQLAGALFAYGRLLLHLHTGKTPLNLAGSPRGLQPQVLRELGRLALATSASSLQSGVTLVLTLALAVKLGTEAVAAYGIAARLEFLMVILLSSVGSAAVTVTSVNLGAQRLARVHRAAWVGTLLVGTAFAALGLIVYAAPQLWPSLFQLEPRVAANAAGYLRAVAPCWGLLGLGLMSYFVGQGIGRPLPFLLGGTVRLLALLLLAWISAATSLVGFGQVVTLSYAVFGLYGLAMLWQCTRPYRAAVAKASTPAPAPASKVANTS